MHKMEEKLKANLERGKKWKVSRDKAKFFAEQGKIPQKDADWFDTQPSIVQDIEAYEDSLKSKEKPKSKEDK